MFRSAVIPAAGLGTRMIPYSKEVPKEMLPIIANWDGRVAVLPVLHYIYNALFDVGIRNFYVVVGRGKRVIEDYFSPDWSYVEYLEERGKDWEAGILRDLYRRIDESNILFVNQPEPRGFGDAVYRTRDFMVSGEFIVHAGDDITHPDHRENIERLIEHYNKHRPAAVFLYSESKHPERYGVILGERVDDYMVVKDIVEKPRAPPSGNVVIAIYIFNKKIYEALEETRPRERGREHQLTDAIKLLIETGEEVHAVRVRGGRLDLGTPDQYYEALRTLISGSTA